jgi:heme-degrading monooxygenase HmoA
MNRCVPFSPPTVSQLTTPPAGGGVDNRYGGEMTEIAPERDAITVINVFTVEPQNQHLLVDLLRNATVGVMAKQPGYISARIHRGLDGTRVAVCAQWRSREDFQALATIPDAAAHMRRARVLASFEPVLYEVVFTHLPEKAVNLPPGQPEIGAARR